MPRWLAAALLTLASISARAAQVPAATSDVTARIDALLTSCDQLLPQARFDEMAAAGQEATALSRTAEDPARRARALHCVVAGDFYRSRFTDALPIAQEAVAAADESRDATMRAITANDLASVLQSLHRDDQAIVLYAKARTAFHALGNTEREANVLRNTAQLYAEMGENSHAERFARDGARLARLHHHALIEAVSLEVVANVEANTGRSASATAHYTRALALGASLNIPGLRLELLANMGLMYVRQQAYRKAIAVLAPEIAAARAVGGESEALMLTMIGASHLALGEWDAAAHSLTRARDLYRQFDDVAQRSWFVDVLYGRLERARGRDDAALASYRDALAAIDRVRLGAVRTEIDRASVLATRREAFVETVDLLVSMQRPTEAFDVAERYRARAFLDTLGESRDGGPPLTVLDAARTRQQLDADTALVEFQLGEPRSFVWVVSHGDVRVASLPGQREIERLVASWRVSLTTRVSALTAERSRAQVDQQGRVLYDRLLRPVDDALAQAHRLIVIPDGTLTSMPFEALVRRATGGRPEYLCERVAISYAPSASALAALRASPPRPRRGRTLLAFGDPDYGGLAALTPLPATRDEVTAIAGLYDAADRQVYLGAAARVERMKSERLDQYRYLHFAAHGRFDEGHPSRSGIMLASGHSSTAENVLTVDEIRALHLDADLVTLSACATGLGRLVGGEGLLGLARAFFYAGSRSVVTSLWNVNDNATAALMTSFYTNLNNGLWKTEALRAAKRELMHHTRIEWRHPYYWAAFTLAGLPN